MDIIIKHTTLWLLLITVQSHQLIAAQPNILSNENMPQPTENPLTVLLTKTFPRLNATMPDSLITRIANEHENRSWYHKLLYHQSYAACLELEQFLEHNASGDFNKPLLSKTRKIAERATKTILNQYSDFDQEQEIKSIILIAQNLRINRYIQALEK